MKIKINDIKEKIKSTHVLHMYNKRQQKLDNKILKAANRKEIPQTSRKRPPQNKTKESNKSTIHGQQPQMYKD